MSIIGRPYFGLSALEMNKVLVVASTDPWRRRLSWLGKFSPLAHTPPARDRQHVWGGVTVVIMVKIV